MRNKSFIIGLVLLLVGSCALWWVVSERRREREEADFFKLKYGSETNEYIQQYEQWLKLPPDERSELPLVLDQNGSSKTPEQIRQQQQERLKADMDKLAAGEMTVYPFADDFYGEDWQEELQKYKKRKELNEFIFTGSIVCTSFGGIIVAWFILLNIARLLIRILAGLKSLLIIIFRGKKESTDPVPDEAEEKESEPEKKPDKKQEEFGELSKVLVNSGWQQPEFVRGKTKIRRQKSDVSMNSESDFEKKEDDDSKEHSKGWSVQKSGKKPEVQNKKESIRSKEKHNKDTMLLANPEQANPIDNTLKDLTQQVSAIREYAANQQNRLEKLQDGYDWNIIRNFCLRIIRCIDNIEIRIAQLTEQECEVTDLEEIRDELIFALESSGVEQFEPEINSEYRGQEKYAEAVKEKKQCSDPKQKGKIEKVIRPGYQCFIDDDNCRIIRPAQVRLYA
jgi:molecular chaperone GrpE (heat shock protein)